MRFGIWNFNPINFYIHIHKDKIHIRMFLFKHNFDCHIFSVFHAHQGKITLNSFIYFGLCCIRLIVLQNYMKV